MRSSDRSDACGAAPTRQTIHSGGAVGEPAIPRMRQSWDDGIIRTMGSPGDVSGTASSGYRGKPQLEAIQEEIARICPMDFETEGNRVRSRHRIDDELIQAVMSCQWEYLGEDLEEPERSEVLACQAIQIQPAYDLKDLLRAQGQDPLVNAMREVIDGTSKELQEHGFLRYEKTWFRKNRNRMELSKSGVLLRRTVRPATGAVERLIIVPMTYRGEVLRYAHDLMGHQGTKRTNSKILERFDWPGLSQDVRRFVASCDRCEATKNPPRKQRFPMRPIISTRRNQILQIDFEKLSVSSEGHVGLLVACDHYTKYARAFPLRDFNAPEAMRVLFEGWISYFGSPETIQSDQGQQFECDLFQQWTEYMGSVKRRSSVYHPQSNGLVERWNKTIVNMLKVACALDQKDWHLHLAKAMFAYNSSIHETTKFSPMELFLGICPRTPLNWIFEEFETPLIKNPLKILRRDYMNMPNYFKVVRCNMRAAQARQKRGHDKRIANLKVWKSGDLVMVWSNYTRKRGGVPKLEKKWHGPYEVKNVLQEGRCYELEVRRASGALRKEISHFERIKGYNGRPSQMVMTQDGDLLYQVWSSAEPDREVVDIEEDGSEVGVDGASHASHEDSRLIQEKGNEIPVHTRGVRIRKKKRDPNFVYSEAEESSSEEEADSEEDRHDQNFVPAGAVPRDQLMQQETAEAQDETDPAMEPARFPTLDEHFLREMLGGQLDEQGNPLPWEDVLAHAGIKEDRPLYEILRDLSENKEVPLIGGGTLVIFGSEVYITPAAETSDDDGLAHQVSMGYWNHQGDFVRPRTPLSMPLLKDLPDVLLRARKTRHVVLDGGQKRRAFERDLEGSRPSDAHHHHEIFSDAVEHLFKDEHDDQKPGQGLEPASGAVGEMPDAPHQVKLEPNWEEEPAVVKEPTSPGPMDLPGQEQVKSEPDGHVERARPVRSLPGPSNQGRFEVAPRRPPISGPDVGDQNLSTKSEGAKPEAPMPTPPRAGLTFTERMKKWFRGAKLETSPSPASSAPSLPDGDEAAKLFDEMSMRTFGVQPPPRLEGDDAVVETHQRVDPEIYFKLPVMGREDPIPSKDSAPGLRLAGGATAQGQGGPGESADPGPSETEQIPQATGTPGTRLAGGAPVPPEQSDSPEESNVRRLRSRQVVNPAVKPKQTERRPVVTRTLVPPRDLPPSAESLDLESTMNFRKTVIEYPPGPPEVDVALTEDMLSECNHRNSKKRKKRKEQKERQAEREPVEGTRDVPPPGVPSSPDTVMRRQPKRAVKKDLHQNKPIVPDERNDQPGPSHGKDAGKAADPPMPKRISPRLNPVDDQPAVSTRPKRGVQDSKQLRIYLVSLVKMTLQDLVEPVPVRGVVPPDWRPNWSPSLEGARDDLETCQKEMRTWSDYATTDVTELDDSFRTTAELACGAIKKLMVDYVPFEEVALRSGDMDDRMLALEMRARSAADRLRCLSSRVLGPTGMVAKIEETQEPQVIASNVCDWYSEAREITEMTWSEYLSYDGDWAKYKRHPAYRQRCEAIKARWADRHKQAPPLPSLASLAEKHCKQDSTGASSMPDTLPMDVHPADWHPRPNPKAVPYAAVVVFVRETHRAIGGAASKGTLDVRWLEDVLLATKLVLRTCGINHEPVERILGQFDEIAEKHDEMERRSKALHERIREFRRIVKPGDPRITLGECKESSVMACKCAILKRSLERRPTRRVMAEEDTDCDLWTAVIDAAHEGSEGGRDPRSDRASTTG